MIPYLEKDCENVLRTSNMQKFARMRLFFLKRVKTIGDVNDGFGDRTPACRECTHPRAD